VTSALLEILGVRARELDGAKIRLWGDVWPEGFDGRADSVSHRLSLAACAFKAQVMAAVNLYGEPTADTEVFRRGGFIRPRLVPATLQNA
jgi:hypothetical protein